MRVKSLEEDEQESSQGGVKIMKTYDRSNARSKTLFSGIAFLLGLLLTQSPVNADDLPTFRHGMWTFHRTMAGKSMEAKKCIDPSGDILQKSGCKLSSVKKSGNTYTFTADCQPVAPTIPELGGRMTVTLTVVSDSFYKVESHGIINGKAAKEFLDARRTGDCTK
jgi:hypothetical protein